MGTVCTWFFLQCFFFFFFFLRFIYLFWPRCAAFGMLVPWPGTEPSSPTVEGLPTGPPGQALTMYVLNVFSLFDDGSTSPPCAFSPHWSNFMFVTKARTPRCQDPKVLGPRGTEACSVSGPLRSPGQKVSECHQEEEAGRLCPACLCDP